MLSAIFPGIDGVVPTASAPKRVAGALVILTAAGALFSAYIAEPAARGWRDYLVTGMALAKATTQPDTVLFGDSRLAYAEVGRPGMLVTAIGGVNIRGLRRIAPTICTVATPETVGFMLGTNDSRLTSPVAVAQVIEDLRSLIAACPAKRVIVFGVWPFEGFGYTHPRQFSIARSRQINDRMRDLCAELGCEYVPAPLDVTGLTKDGVHFLPAGNARLRGTIEGAI